MGNSVCDAQRLAVDLSGVNSTRQDGGKEFSYASEV